MQEINNRFKRSQNVKEMTVPHFGKPDKPGLRKFVTLKVKR